MSFPVELLRILTDSSWPVIVYGEHNSGKTIFLFQLSKALLQRDYKVLYFITHNNIKTFHLQANLLSRNNIINVDTLDEILPNLLSIDTTIKNTFTKRETKIITLIDINIMPFSNYTTSEIDLFRKLLFLSTTMTSTSTTFENFDYCIIYTAQENIYEGLPYNWRIFLKYNINIFVRIERISRVRKITIKKYDFSSGTFINYASFYALLTPSGFKFEKKYFLGRDSSL